MLSDPATWILFSFVLFLIITAKKLVVLTKEKLDGYINNVKNNLDSLQDTCVTAECDLKAAKEQAKLVEAEIKSITEQAVIKAKEARKHYFETSELMSERINSQFDNDMAIERKFERKQMSKRLRDLIKQNLIESFEQSKTDNADLSLDDLDLKKLFDAKK